MEPCLAQWIRPIFAPESRSYDKKIEQEAMSDVKRSLATLNTHLTHHTFLVGEQISYADIQIFSHLYTIMGKFLDEAGRKEYKQVCRYFNTLLNQPEFKACSSDFEYCKTPLTYDAKVAAERTAAAKTGAAAAKPAKKEAKPATQKDTGDDDEAKPEPKPKSKLDLLPPSTFVLDDWKRFYSNNDFRSKSIEYLWKNFDAKGWSIWRVEYKYNDELTQVFMSSNLIGGFFNRLERARKYAFGSLVVTGKNNDSKIVGAFIIRGDSIPEEVADAADFESYKFTKLDSSKPEDRAYVEDAFGWDGKNFEGANTVADGKVFK